MPSRTQSGIELITTYGFMMLLVSIALLVILLVPGSLQGTIPSSCSIYGTMTCGDVVFGSNGMGGSKLIILAFVSISGIVNVSSFNAVAGGVDSTSGYCTLSGSPEGATAASAQQAMLCEATFPFNATESETYSGTFNISANYCPPLESGSPCDQASSYTFAGDWRASSTYSVVVTTTSTSSSTSSTI